MFENRDEIIKLCTKNSVPYMVHYDRHVSEFSVFSNASNTDVGYRVNDKILSFPCHAFMTEGEIEKVQDILYKIRDYEIRE